MMRAIVLFMLLLCSAALSQPVITWEDYPANNYSVLTTFTAIDAEGQAFPIGEKNSSGNVYHFDTYTYDAEVSTSEYVAPASTPYFSNFPNATHAMKSATDYGAAYAYNQFSNNVLYNLGVGSSYGGYSVIIKFDPIQPSVKFPLHIGDSWDYHSNPIEIIPGLTQTFITHSEAYASGTLVLPGGSYECLVLKVTGVIDEVYFDGMQTQRLLQRNVSYNFLTNAGMAAGISVDTLDEESTAPLLLSAAYTIPSGGNAVDKPQVAGNLSLHPAYPNPVAEGSDSYIAWSLEQAAQIHVAVYDVMGREVRTVFEGQGAPGMQTLPIGTRDLAPGMYFLRMQSGATVLSRPVVVWR